ncbi:MAG: hypothetical protein R2737_06295 [Candidatus Nanopelagicales bacterium]
MTHSLRRPAPLLLAVAVLVTLVAALLPALPARAATPSPKWEQAQVGLDYSVYAPTQTLGLKMKSFKLLDCAAPGLDEQIAAQYGSVNGRGFEIFESQNNCEDGPAPVALVATFSVDGALARVFVLCPGSYWSCKKIGTAGLKKYGGYTEVILPAGSSLLQPTLVTLWSTRLTLTDIKKVTRGLTFAG